MDSSPSQRSAYVRGLFDRIAGRYDLLNRVISLRLDARWRKQAVAAALSGDEKMVLDLGTGTGDLAFLAGRAIGKKGKVIGIDFALEMLRLANAKRRAVVVEGRTPIRPSSRASPEPRPSMRNLGSS